ncbi:MAG: multidrug efflux SMR transporter [Actinomycetaceae bacterium]|nr:multidrug efflux SMR transporter [Actinomycetaceae bacterium]
MAWAILLGSAVFEAVWATALGMSDGFREVGPTVVFVLAMIVSVGGLSYAMKTIPVGTAYAVWTAVGAALTVAYAMLSGNETATPLKIFFLVGIIGFTVGLKLVGSENAEC